jgi:L-2,4-diaminobutyrate decarboxylase
MSATPTDSTETAEDLRPHYLDAGNAADVEACLQKVLALALEFKTRPEVSRHHSIAHFLKKYVAPLPAEGCSEQELLDTIRGVLAESINWSSEMFMGFNDAGNSVAGLMGALVESTCQQNLINSDFSARAATFVEIATVRWLRELAGYDNPAKLRGVSDLGGVATTGGTCSNMYGLLMARKNFYPDSIRAGIPRAAKPRILVPADITHYSVAGAVGLVGFGTDSILKVPTKDFRMDLNGLEQELRGIAARGEDAVALVVNAGDSRTLTLDDFTAVDALRRRLAPKCWIHVDACNGGQLLFSSKYRGRLRGIETADSIALDPHKVFNVPYTLSYFLFKNPKNADGFWSSSTLIMRDPWALGQLTPNIGSKSWASLKLYLLVKRLGKERLGALIDRRIELSARFRGLLAADERFRLVTGESDVNSVPFVYVGDAEKARADPARLFAVNEAIYARMLQEGSVYVHGFPIKDDGDCLGRGRETKLFVLRFMTGNPAVGESELARLIAELARLGAAAEDAAASRR